MVVFHSYIPHPAAVKFSHQVLYCLFLCFQVRRLCFLWATCLKQMIFRLGYNIFGILMFWPEFGTDFIRQFDLDIYHHSTILCLLHNCYLFLSTAFFHRCTLPVHLVVIFVDAIPYVLNQLYDQHWQKMDSEWSNSHVVNNEYDVYENYVREISLVPHIPLPKRCYNTSIYWRKQL